MKHTLLATIIAAFLVIVLLCIYPWALPIAVVAAVWHYIGWLIHPDQD